MRPKGMNDRSYQKHTGMELKKFRDEMKMSQKQLAEMLGCDVELIQQFED